MKSASVHPLWRTALEGTNLVEASAGTGKTWTIAGLYLRLVVERGLAPANILAVTFTNAATAELKARIRGRLVALSERLAKDVSTDDPLIEPLFAAITDRAAARARVRLAIDTFDEAAIVTIHSFCQRALGEQAFESALPFETELIVDDAAIRTEVAEDWWRIELAAAGPVWARYLVDRQATPAALLGAADRLLRPGAPRVLVPDPGAWREDEWLHAYAHARTIWRDERDRIEQTVSGAMLRANIYKPELIPAWCAALDAYFESELPSAEVPAPLERFTRAKLAAATLKGRPTPAHEFFAAATDYLEATGRAQSALAARYARSVARFAEHARGALDRKKLERGRHAYDDLIVRLHAALEGEGGAALVERIRKRFAAALVDEFQDTDRLQFEIFARIFPGAPLFLVGDPKQAIYAFRGADVFAYLAARRSAAHTLPLNLNRRSNAPLVKAVNRIFARPRAFVVDGIEFHPAEATSGAMRLLMRAAPPAPLTLWWCESGDGTVLSKDDMRARVANAVAGEIARLLDEAHAGRASLVEGDARRVLVGSDIAVIVRQHREGDEIRAALERRGIASVTYGPRSVFATQAGAELAIVLAAVAAPASEPRVRAALATTIFGLDCDAIAQLAADETAWEAHLTRFARYHEALRAGGVMRMWREMLHRDGIAARLVGTSEGARMLTNLEHLVELVHRLAAEASVEPSALPGLVMARAERAIAESEEMMLRMESDAALVRVLTVHTAKGLEFPVVFCPSLWDGRIGGDQVVFHDPAAGLTLDLGSPEIDVHRAAATAEDLGEAVRLAYVALTRAKAQCYVAWGHVREAWSAPLGWLLHGTEPDPVEGLKRLRERFAQPLGLRAELEALAAKGSLAIVDLPRPSPPAVQLAFDLEARAIGPRARRLERGSLEPWRVSSFSSLAAYGNAEMPDHDELAVPALEDLAEAESEDAFRFPRGARAGSCLHAMFEGIDFATANPAAIQSVARARLAEFGLPESAFAAATRIVCDTLETALDAEGMRLRDVTAHSRRVEMEFTFPVETLTADALARVLADYRSAAELPDGDPSALRTSLARGLMKGFIDCVFERGGRYFIVDYKSNWLGGSLADYAPDRLAQAITASHYDLQYLIYSVALDRLLAWRLRDYAFERHFGGVYYLFVRGLRPARGPASGVFFARPAREIVVRLGASVPR